MTEADPRDSGYRALGEHIEREGFTFEYREYTRDRPPGIDQWTDHYRHPDGRSAVAYQMDSEEYCTLVGLRGTEH
ncbi:MAG: hypothetical protein EOO77_44055 [Oxalobacteraceae bacterium]|nr:MAG: hypothetical protein EOO77_44055 [Oxalobacteraceae bacterium]